MQKQYCNHKVQSTVRKLNARMSFEGHKQTWNIYTFPFLITIFYECMATGMCTRHNLRHVSQQINIQTES